MLSLGRTKYVVNKNMVVDTVPSPRDSNRYILDNVKVLVNLSGKIIA